MARLGVMLGAVATATALGACSILEQPCRAVDNVGAWAAAFGAPLEYSSTSRTWEVNGVLVGTSETKSSQVCARVDLRR